MSTAPQLPEPLTVDDVYRLWGQLLDTLDTPSSTDDPTSTHVRLTVYRYGNPHLTAVSPALYAKHFADLGVPTPDPVVIPPAQAAPWRPDLNDPRPPMHVALGSRGAHRSWSEIHTQVTRRGIHVTVLRTQRGPRDSRTGRPAAVFVPLDWST